MTAKKDLKRRVRARQAQTGESYVTARRQVMAQAGGDEDVEDTEAPERPSAPVIEVDETIDLTEQGATLGFQCRIYSTSKLAALVDQAVVLRRLRTILDTTSEDPHMKHFRAVILRGERPRIPPRNPDWLDATKRFVSRARAGIGGVSDWGNMLAFTHDNVIILVNIGFRPPSTVMTDLPPRLVLSALVEDGFSTSLLYVR